jgi:purine-nucleoside phosphorylase
MRYHDPTHIEEAVEMISTRTVHRPKVGLILGSGLGSMAGKISIATDIPYSEIPRFSVSTAPEHKGHLVVGRLSGHAVAVMRGRLHFYEGYSMADVTFPIRVMQRLGVRVLIVTNAAGAVNPDFEPCDIMLITDHVSFVSMAGHNPLIGPHYRELGARFPDMSQVYDLQLQTTALTVADRLGEQLREGVYACVSGPSFETPAEVRLLRTIGADAVGMSTAPEATVARQAGMRVLGFSAITNVAIAETASTKTTSAAEVLEIGAIVAPRLASIIEGVLQDLPARSS